MVINPIVRGLYTHYKDSYIGSWSTLAHMLFNVVQILDLVCVQNGFAGVDHLEKKNLYAIASPGARLDMMRPWKLTASTWKNGGWKNHLGW